jgi:FkbM family methyltransferase
LTEAPQPHQPTGVAIAECRYGKMMYLRGDVFIGRSLEHYGEFSEIEVAALLRLIGPGDVVVDAGANIGALMLPFARRVGPQGRVYAFEPQLTMFHLLAGNIALNELTQVEALRIALGDRGGIVAMPSLGYRATANYGGLALGTEGPAREEAPLRRLDDFGLDSLRLLKADVEGTENQLIAGAAETIRRCRPVLWIENDRRPKSAELISRLLAFDYRLWWHIAPLFNPDNFKGDKTNVIGPYVSINVLGIPVEMNANIAGLREITGAEDWWKPD